MQLMSRPKAKSRSMLLIQRLQVKEHPLLKKLLTLPKLKRKASPDSVRADVFVKGKTQQVDGLPETDATNVHSKRKKQKRESDLPKTDVKMSQANISATNGSDAPAKQQLDRWVMEISSLFAATALSNPNGLKQYHLSKMDEGRICRDDELDESFFRVVMVR